MHRRYLGLKWLSLSYFLYSLALGAAMLLTLPYWLYRILRYGKYRSGLLERMGAVPARILPADSKPHPFRQRVIWVHAVSVGEVLAVSGLVDELRRNFPQYRVLVSTTTPTGQELARKRFGESCVFYFPIDFALAIRPYLAALQPELVVLAETEFWPNFLRLAHEAGARIAVVNARISDRSWPRYRRFPWALARMLAHVDLFLPQTSQDAARLQSIGADAARVRVTGNLKFDLNRAPSPPLVNELRQALNAQGGGPVLVCGSTVDGEEGPLLNAFQNVIMEHPRTVMILAPRRPERFDQVASLVRQIGTPMTRRSHWHGEPISGGVFLLDSIGELAALYELADIAFVGGSLVPRGGHNIIEPAQYGAAIVVGKYTENFRDIVAAFQERDAVRVVTLAELPLTIMDLLRHEAERLALGSRALETMRSQSGARARTLAALTELLAENGDRSIPAQAAHTV